MEQFVEVVNKNVDEVEKSLDIAEEDLNVTDYSLKGLIIKPLLAKAMSGTSAGAASMEEVEPVSNLNSDGEFQPVTIFNTSDYFDPSKSPSSQ